MATREKMNSTRKTAIVVGVLFIIGTVAGFLALFVFAGPILEDPDYLVKFSANESQIVRSSAPCAGYGLCTGYGSGCDVSAL